MPALVDKQKRPLSTIASDIRETWANVSPHAEPYLQAMEKLNLITDRFYEDDADTVVIYFLENAKGWRGEDAQRIKAELKAMIGRK